MTEQGQIKHADTIWGVGGYIPAQAFKLDTLKTHEKGLMQQLFPSADEVTG